MACLRCGSNTNEMIKSNQVCNDCFSDQSEWRLYDNTAIMEYYVSKFEVTPDKDFYFNFVTPPKWSEIDRKNDPIIKKWVEGDSK